MSLYKSGSFIVTHHMKGTKNNYLFLGRIETDKKIKNILVLCCWALYFFSFLMLSCVNAP